MIVKMMISVSNDEDDLFKKIPTLKSDRNEGTLILSIYNLIIIAIDDFIKEFSSINVCYIRNWEELRIR